MAQPPRLRWLPTDRRARGVALAGYGVVAFGVLALVILAAFPFGMLKPWVADRLSRQVGRPVAIGRIERLDGFSLEPTVAIRDVRIPQAEWAGRGDLVRIDRADVRFPVLPLLLGRFQPQAIDIVGARLALARAADGRVNWRRRDDGRGSGGGIPVLDRLRIADTIVSYRDAVRNRALVVPVDADPTKGLRVWGRGAVTGAPVRIEAVGAPIAGHTDTPWPFRAAIDGPMLGITAAGTMRRALDVRHMTLAMTARADDLKTIDAVIEAGLFGTQAVHLAAQVAHDGHDWRVRDLTGTIGTSQIAGQIDADRVDGRTKLNGTIRSSRLVPADLASDAGLAKAAALRNRIGKRLVPDLRVDIHKIARTDGTLTFDIARIVSAGSALRSARGTLTLDHRRLIVAPLTIGLAQGAITGQLVVDQQGGAPKPKVTVDLHMAGSSIGALAGGGGSVTGSFAARAYLVGRGRTIREAVGNATGRIGLAARDGSLPTRIADALGFDAGRAVLAGGEDRAGLRCVILGLDVKDGLGQVAPLILDTTKSQLRGTGTIRFPDETLTIRLTGAPKRDSLIRLPGSATLAGTIEEPDLIIPHEVKSVGNVFKAIGRAIRGDQGPLATDADCAGLAASVLR